MYYIIETFNRETAIHSIKSLDEAREHIKETIKELVEKENIPEEEWYITDNYLEGYCDSYLNHYDVFVVDSDEIRPLKHRSIYGKL